jgi:hypothetical protein
LPNNKNNNKKDYMGSWYGTCGVTQLPLVGEDIVCLPIVQRKTSYSGSDFCYNNEVWEPCGIPIFGTYDDYGQIAPDDGQDQVHLFNAGMLGQSLVEYEGDSRIEKVDKDFIMGIDGWQEAIHEDHLHVAGHGYEDMKTIKKAVGRMFILRRVWDALVTETPEQNYRGVTHDKALYLAEIQKQVMANSRMSTWSHHTILSNSHSNMNDQIVLALQEHYRGTLVDGQTDPAVEMLMEQFAEYCVFNDALTGLRKHYAPQTGAGSQDREYKNYIVMMKAMIQVMKENDDEYGEWADGPDDTEYEQRPDYAKLLGL